MMNAKEMKKKIRKANKTNVRTINKGIDKLQKTAKKHPNATMALVAGAAAAVIVDAGCKIAYVGIPVMKARMAEHEIKKVAKETKKAERKAAKEAKKAKKAKEATQQQQQESDNNTSENMLFSNEEIDQIYNMLLDEAQQEVSENENAEVDGDEEAVEEPVQEDTTKEPITTPAPKQQNNRNRKKNKKKRK